MGVDESYSADWPRPKVEVVVWALLAATILLVWFNSHQNKKLQKKYRLPPGPPTYPIIGNLHVLLSRKKAAHQLVDDLAKTYGSMMLLKVGVQNMVFVTDAELTMEILKAQDHLLANRPAAFLLGKYLLYGESHIPLAQSGEYHSFFRKVLATELLSYKKLQGLQKGIRMEEQTFMIREAYIAAKSKESLNVHRLVNTVALNLVTRVGFGKRFLGLDLKGDDKESKSREVWTSIIREMMEWSVQYLAEDVHPSLYWVDTLTGVRRGMQSFGNRVDALLQTVLDEHKHRLDALSPRELEEYKPKHFMDMMLLLRGKENGQYITDRSIKAVAVDFIVAGSDTVTAILEWCMTELLRAPDAMKRAQEEVDNVVGFDRVVDESDVPNMPFLAAVVKETFRLHPPVPWLLPHSNRADHKVGGYDIPKDSFININVYGMGRSAAYWPEPLKFNPDRFYSNSMANEIDMRGTHPQLLPFGSGRRICPGIYMARAIIYSTLARMLHSFDWKFTGKEGATEIDMGENSGVVACKKIPLEAFGTPRLPTHLY